MTDKFLKREEFQIICDKNPPHILLILYVLTAYYLEGEQKKRQWVPYKNQGMAAPYKNQGAPYKNLGEFYRVPFKSLLRVQIKRAID